MADQLGTPRMVIDQTGALATTKRHDYLPFGEELYATQGARTTALGYTGDNVRQKFTSYERDTETNLDFAQARYYANTQGRFTSIDPLMASAEMVNPQSFNRYSYGLNSPSNNTDPSGMISLNNTSAMGQWARNCDNGPATGGALAAGGIEKTLETQPQSNIRLWNSIVSFFEALPQTPKYPPVTSAEVNVVYGGQAFESIQSEIVSAIVDISNRQGCSDAFKEFKLTIPYDVVKSGKLRIAGVAALYEDNAGQLLGLTPQEIKESKAKFAEQGGWFGSGFRKRLTAERAYPSVPVAIFNPNVIRNPIFGGLRDVVTHVFIHLGGRSGDPSAKPHDLANFSGYVRITNACR